MFVNSDNYIKYLKLWLITLFLLIISMVAVGGLTRLTDSGLSITAWELFTGWRWNCNSASSILDIYFS